MALMTIEEARPAPAPGHGAPLFALGFRPFYLLAAAFGAAAVPLWIAAQAGLRVPARVDMLWHMHEMVFGFALAVVVGFLYTAGYNWTKLWTPRGRLLAAIAGVWVAGRIAMLAAPPEAGVVASPIGLRHEPLTFAPLAQGAFLSRCVGSPRPSAEAMISTKPLAPRGAPSRASGSASLAAPAIGAVACVAQPMPSWRIEGRLNSRREVAD